MFYHGKSCIKVKNLNFEEPTQNETPEKKYYLTNKLWYFDLRRFIKGHRISTFSEICLNNCWHCRTFYSWIIYIILNFNVPSRLIKWLGLCRKKNTKTCFPYELIIHPPSFHYRLKKTILLFIFNMKRIYRKNIIKIFSKKLS